MARYRIYLCGGPIDAKYLNPPIPPEVTTCADHTPTPEGYLAWHEFAQTLSKTHKQERCGECGLFSIWRPRKSTR